MIDLNIILKELAQERPLFHSEKDFQLALAWTIKRYYENKGESIQIRLEQRFKPSNSDAIYLDIVIKHKNKHIPIELKYKTKKFEIDIMGENFELKAQSAPDSGIYDFARDISRLENFVKQKDSRIGYALFLTNDPGYWTKSNRKAKYDDFKIYENRKLEGTLKWKKGAEKSTKQNREKPIKLKNTYNVKWRNYSKPEEVNLETEFRYLLLEIKNR